MINVGGYDIELQMKKMDELVRVTINPNELMTSMATDITIPPVLDLRQYLPRRSQKNEGSCEGHAQTFATECTHWMKTGIFKRFSPDFAYYKAQMKDGIRGDNGATITGGMRVALEDGSLEEQYMPYTPKYNPGDIPANAAELAAPFKCLKGARLQTYREVVEWQARGFGMTWWGISWGLQESSPGWITKFRAGRGGHAIGLGMWGEEGREPPKMESDGLPPWLWQINSWTDNPDEVSLNGFCRITRDVIERAMEHPHTVVVGVSDMAVLENRPFSFLDNPMI